MVHHEVNTHLRECAELKRVRKAAAIRINTVVGYIIATTTTGAPRSRREKRSVHLKRRVWRETPERGGEILLRGASATAAARETDRSPWDCRGRIPRRQTVSAAATLPKLLPSSPTYSRPSYTTPVRSYRRRLHHHYRPPQLSSFSTITPPECQTRPTRRQRPFFFRRRGGGRLYFFCARWC